MAVGKEPIAVHVPQVFLEPAQRPRAIRPRRKNVLADVLAPACPSLCGSGKRSGSIRRMKWLKRSSSPWCGVAVSSSRWSLWLGQLGGQLVALRRYRPAGLTAGADALRVGAAFVRFVDDDQVPALLPDALADIVLFRVVQRGDDLRFPLPEIR